MQERRPIVQPISRVPIIYPALFYDDGNGAFNYVITADGSDYVASYQTYAAYVSAKAIFLKTRITTPTTGDKCTIYKSLPLPPTKLVRLRALFAQTPFTRIAYFYAFLYYYDGTNLHGPELFFNGSDGKVYYAAAFRSSYTDTGLTFPLVQHAWTAFDWSINLDTALFHSLTVNNAILDMSAIAIPTSASAVTPQLRLYFEIEAYTDAFYNINIAQVLLTAENP